MYNIKTLLKYKNLSPLLFLKYNVEMMPCLLILGTGIIARYTLNGWPL